MKKILEYIKQNYKFLLFLVFIAILFSFPLPYYIHKPGSVVNIDEKVFVNNSYDSEGSFNFVYVSELRATFPTTVLSYLFDSWDIKLRDEIYNSNESYEDLIFRSEIYLSTTNKYASYLAYTKAGKSFELYNAHNYVVYLYPEINSVFKVGDEILKVAGKEITGIEEYLEIINKLEFGDKINILVKRDKIETNLNVEIFNYEGSKVTGILFFTDYDYLSDPEINYMFQSNESGPSGGLMLALNIYNKLIPYDITNGKNIAGTGTIDMLGNVGEIGGVKYKIISAAKNDIDLFLVPSDNYNEALDVVTEYDLDLNILSVSTFEEAISKLENNF